MDALLTPKDVASRLSMSLVWVYKAAESGILPFYRVGEAIRFDDVEIMAYLESRKNLARKKRVN